MVAVDVGPPVPHRAAGLHHEAGHDLVRRRVGRAVRAEQGENAATGMGTASCAKYLNALEKYGANNEIADGVLTWTQGFLSGINFQRIASGKRSFDIPDRTVIDTFTREWCRKNTLDDFIAGAYLLSEELVERQGR